MRFRDSSPVSLLLPVCLLVLLVCGPGFSIAFADDAESLQRIRKDVRKLASDELEGRGVGTAGLDKAAALIAKTFRQAGLDVTLAGGDPYQEFEITDGAELGEPNSLVFRGPDGQTMELEMGRDFQVCSFGGSGEMTGELVFAGYGIDAEKEGYNDYADLDVKDKIVIVMRRNPLQSDPHGPFAVGHGISRHAALTTKLSRAFARDAQGVIFVNDPFTQREERKQLEEQLATAQDKLQQLQSDGVTGQDLKDAQVHLEQVQTLLEEFNDDPLMTFGYGGTRRGNSPPAFHLSQQICNAVLQPALGMTLPEIEAQIDETGEPVSRPLTGWSVSGEASLNIIKVPVKNVIGVLEGAGPHKEETIVIGAHFDHLGRGGPGSLAPNSKEIHNGADDNASGTAGLMEIARRLGEREEPLPRRIVLIAFNAEERGLLGAKEYVDSPLFPLEDTVAMLNMDMIGRLDGGKLTIFGTGTSSVWEQLIASATAQTELEIIKKPEGFGPSDHSVFYGKKIPVLHFFTGIHDDYHRPSDDWEKLNIEGMRTIVDILEQIATAVATAEVRPDYIEISGSSTLTRSGSRPYFGSIPDFGETAEGYAISGVSPDSPADQGGLQGGDVIVEFGGRKVGSLDDFDLALRDFAPGQQVQVIVLRGGERVKLKVTLATPKN